MYNLNQEGAWTLSILLVTEILFGLDLMVLLRAESLNLKYWNIRLSSQSYFCFYVMAKLFCSSFNSKYLRLSITCGVKVIKHDISIIFVCQCWQILNSYKYSVGLCTGPQGFAALIYMWLENKENKKTFIDISNLHCDLDLERGNPIFTQDTPTYNAVLSNQVWLHTDQQFRSYSKNCNILII